MSDEASAAPRLADLLIEGGLVVTLDPERRVIADGSVAIQGDRIVAVGPRETVAAAYQGRQVLDARRRVVVPGYVDGHVHTTAEMLSRGFVPDSVGQPDWTRLWAAPLYAAITPDEEYVAALLAAAEMLRNGTTAFCEGGTIKDVSRVAQAIDEAGIRGTLGKWTWDCVPQLAALHQDTDQALAATEELAERYHGAAGGRIRMMAAVINVKTASERLLRGLKDLAVRRGLMMNWHQSGGPDYVPAALAEWGIRPIERLREQDLLGPNVRLVHMVNVDEREVEILAETDTRVVHCPTTALRLAYGAGPIGRFPEMVAAGMTVALGTDGVNASDHLDMGKATYLTAGLFKDGRQDPIVFPAEQVLELATLHGARAMRWDDEIGSLEVGKKADVVLLDRDRPEMVPLVNVANTLVYATDGRSADTVIVDGRVVVAGGHLRTIDEAWLYRTAEQLAPELIARSGLPLERRWAVQGER
ncbi:MAG TPA: amidohydrolase family protein [Chloroflexota bacterium]|jgi:cytosine/adenosine deaminase-related metal-dependent hydrolase